MGSRDSGTIDLFEQSKATILRKSRTIEEIVSEKFRTTVAIVSANSRIVPLKILEQSGTITKIMLVQEILEQSGTIATINSGTVTAASLVGIMVSSRSARPTGIAIGTVTATTGGAVTVAGSSTTLGSFSISDSSPGMAIPTITTPPITIIRISTVMIPAFTKGTITTARVHTSPVGVHTSLPIRTPLAPRRSDWRGKVITEERSTASSAGERAARSCAISATTVCA